MLKERFELASERIREIPEEKGMVEESFRDYFRSLAGMILGVLSLAQAGDLESRAAPLGSLLQEIRPGFYEKSYACPSFACRNLGEDLGRPLSVLYYEICSMTVPALYGALEELLIRMELFLEVYQAFVTAFRETGGVPEGRYMTGKIRDYLSDYFREETLRRLRALTGPYGESAPAPFFFPAPEEEEKEAEKEAEIKAEALSESFLESLRLKGFKGEGSGVCGLRAGSKMLFSLASCALSSRGIRALPYTGSWSLFGLRADLGPRAFFRADPRFFADHSEDLGLFLDESLRTRILQALESALSEAEEDLSSFAGWVFWEEEGKDRGLPMDPMAVRMGRHQKKLLSALLEREEEMIRERGLFLTEEDVFRMPL